MCDIKNNASFPICRGRGGQFGTPSKASRTDHPVCAAFVASRHYLDGAATPPLRGGECGALKLRPNGNIIDIWLRLRRAMLFVVLLCAFCGSFCFRWVKHEGSSFLASGPPDKPVVGTPPSAVSLM